MVTFPYATHDSPATETVEQDTQLNKDKITRQKMTVGDNENLATTIKLLDSSTALRTTQILARRT